MQSDKSYYWNKHEIIGHRARTTTCHGVFRTISRRKIASRQSPKEQIMVSLAFEGRWLQVFQAERIGCTWT